MKYLQNIVIVCLLCVSTFGVFGARASAEENTPTQETSTTAVEPRVLRSTATCLAILAAGDDDGDGIIDASNCDLRNQILYVVYWKGSAFYDFTSSNLSGAEILADTVDHRLNFSDANLTSVDFVNFENFFGHEMILKGSTIQDTKFSVATENISYVQPCNLTGTPARLPSSNTVVKSSAFWGIPNANYSGCNFANSDLRGITIAASSMVGVNLAGANLSNSLLHDTNMTNTNLTGTNFTNARFVRNIFRDVVGTPILPTRYRKIGTNIVGPSLVYDGFDFTNADLSNMDLSESYARNVIFNNTNLNGTKLTNMIITLSGDCGTSTFRNADFSYGIFTGDFSSCDLSDVISASTCFNGILPDGYIHAAGRQRCLDGVTYSGFIVGPGLSLSYRDLSGLSFAGANLTNVDFRGSNLSYANFDGMTLTNVDLTDAIMVGTSLVGADLRTASILGLRTGNLVGTPLVPSGYAIRRQHIVGPQVNLFGARLQSLDLSNLDLSDANLSGANLTGANLSNTDLSGANMVRANATNANLSRTELLRANLSRANLTGADLSQSNLEDTDLAGVTVTNARFANAVLHGVKSGRIVGTPASLPNDYAIRDGYFVGTQANLTNAVLTDVNLNGINLSRATLNGLKSRNVIGAPILPSRYRVVKGYVVGPNVSLIGADFTNQSLMNLQLIGADLRNSKLINANLAGTNITNAMFRGADMTRIRSGRMVGTPASLPTGYIIRNGTFVKQ
jgi:uncharacterized protein YjbI with pentapeptide repeats